MFVFVHLEWKWTKWFLSNKHNTRETETQKRGSLNVHHKCYHCMDHLSLRLRLRCWHATCKPLFVSTKIFGFSSFAIVHIKVVSTWGFNTINQCHSIGNRNRHLCFPTYYSADREYELDTRSNFSMQFFMSYWFLALWSDAKHTTQNCGDGVETKKSQSRIKHTAYCERIANTSDTFYYGYRILHCGIPSGGDGWILYNTI